MISTQCKHEAAGFGMFVYLTAELLRDGGDVARVLHAAVIRVGLRAERIVVVDFLIAVQVVAQFFVELVEETGGDEGRGRGVDARLALTAAEANGDDAELRGRREEFGADGGWRRHIERGL